MKNAYLYSAFNGDPKGMRQAKLDGVDINDKNNDGENAYTIGANCGNLEVMTQAQKDGVDVYK